MVKDTFAPIKTDAFVGECCKSMQKFCIEVMLDVLRCDENVILQGSVI